MIDVARLTEAIARLSHTLNAEARRTGEDSCTWDVRVSTGAKVDDGRRVPAGPSVYAGSAGIGLALAYAYHCTRDQANRRSALAAMRHAFEQAGSLAPERFGFHDGLSGIAYALAVAGQLLDSDELAERARRIVARIALRRPADQGGDVIGGEAGAIPALLALGQTYGITDAAPIAVAMGQSLLRTAARLPSGWAWANMQYCRRPLTGLAHGASGYAAALLELAAHTQEVEFWYGACQAYAYERSQFLPQVANWPDYRCNELWRAMYEVGEDGVGRMLAEGKAASLTTTSHMTAWCHGAPGIGLSRIRAFELDGDDRLLAEACTAATTTIASLRDESANYSLCHGHSGNAESVLRVARGAPGTIRCEQAYSRLQQMCDLILDGESPKHGTIGPLPDPTLMLGNAGFLYALARQIDATLPSVLLVEPSSSALELTNESAARLEELQAEAFARCSVNTAALLPSVHGHIARRTWLRADRHASPDNIRTQLRGHFEGGGEETAEVVTAILQDETHSELLGQKLDDVEDTLDRMAVSALSDQSSERVRWHLSKRVTLSRPNTIGEATLNLLIRDGFKTREIELTPFAHSVLQTLRQPVTLQHVASRLMGQRTNRLEETATAKFTDAVRRQVSSAIAAGIVVPAWASIGENSSFDLEQ